MGWSFCYGLYDVLGKKKKIGFWVLFYFISFKYIDNLFFWACVVELIVTILFILGGRGDGGKILGFWLRVSWVNFLFIGESGMYLLFRFGLIFF